MAAGRKAGRTRVERGIYRQPNSKLEVCARRAGRLHFRTAGQDLGEARCAREELVMALAAGRVPASLRLRFDTVSRRWLGRFEAKVEAGGASHRDPFLWLRIPLVPPQRKGRRALRSAAPQSAVSNSTSRPSARVRMPASKVTRRMPDRRARVSRCASVT